MVKFRIYQINIEADKNHAAFSDLKSVMALSPEIYELVYDGEVDKDNKTCLDELFRIFNVERSKGFLGRSMSVSDVVELYDDDSSDFFFCDSFGFQPVEFDKSRIPKTNQ